MNSRIFRSAIAFVLVLVPVRLFSQAAKPAGNAAVAQFQGTVITQDDLEKFAAKDLEDLELQRVQFNASWERNRREVLETSLERLLSEKLLTAEAARRGITEEALLDQELKGKVKDPTEDDVKAFYEANKQRINQPLLQIASQIFSYLKTDNYNKAKAAFVEQLKKQYGASVSLALARQDVATAGSPSQGPASAPVTLVEFSDFQCPYCAKLFTTLHQVLDKYGTQVRLVYRNFPLLQIHPYAEKAAEAGLCAADQGHFWEMHDLMFQTQGQLKEEDLKTKAAQLKLDMESFDSCLDSGQHAEQVKKDLYTGSKLGVTGTPALFINGRFVSGAVPFADIAKVIDEELSAPSRASK